MSTIDIAAPSGYEAVATFNVDSRAWYPTYRKLGATWWTQCAPFGHGQTPRDEVAERAAAAVAQHIAIHAKSRP